MKEIRFTHAEKASSASRVGKLVAANNLVFGGSEQNVALQRRFVLAEGTKQVVSQRDWIAE